MTSTTISADNPWTVLKNNDIFKRSFCACDVYQDRYIVVAGGFGEQFWDTRSAAMYDVKKQSYMALPNIPHHCRSRGVIVNGYFYVAEITYSENINSIKLYRIFLSTRVAWQFVVKLEGHNIIDMVTDGKHIFLISSTTQITRFDPMTGEISHFKRDNQAIKRCYFSSAYVDNKIYIIEGQSNNSTTPKTLIFDTITQLWSEGPPPPTSSPYFTTVVIDRWIVVKGEASDVDGGNVVKPDLCNKIYDTHTHKWTEISTALSTPRQAHRCVKLGPHIVTVGGNGPNVKDSPITAIYIKHVIPEWIWTTLKPYLLLRELVEDNRAAPIIETEKLNYVDAMVQNLFTTMPLDMFRCVLSFLV